DGSGPSAQALAALQASQPGFPMLLPGASAGFFDQNGLSALAAAARGMPQVHQRLMPQMNMLQTAANAAMGNGSMRLLANPSNQNGAGVTQSQNSLFAS